MKLKLFIVVSLVTSLLTVILVSCTQNEDELSRDRTTENQMQEEDEYVVKIAIFPTGSSDESYYYTLTEKGLLSVKKGRRQNDNVLTTPFLKKVDDEKETMLSEENLLQLIQIIEKLYQNSNTAKDESIKILDSWAISVFYHGKVITQENGFDDSVSDLREKIIKVSPIDLDLHGWS